MHNPRLAGRYAKSLLDLSKEQKQVEKTVEDMKGLLDVTSKSRDFARVMNSPIINADKKQAIFNAVIGKQVSPLTNSFISLLFRKNRESNLVEIAQEFMNQYRKLNHIKTVKLTSAAPLSDKVKETIRKKLTASMPSNTFEIKEQVEPDLIGGFILDMDDKRFDASIRRDLNDIQDQFKKNIYVSQLR